MFWNFLPVNWGNGIQFDFHIFFQMGGEKPPTSHSFWSQFFFKKTLIELYVFFTQNPLKQVKKK